MVEVLRRMMLLALALGSTSACRGNDPVAAATSSTGADDASTSTTGDDPTVACDVFQQDCPPASKCLPTAISHIAAIKEDDVTAWCSELASDRAQFGEPCRVERAAYRDAAASYENCDEGLLCWGVGDDDIGRCERLCTGTAQDPACPDGYFCAQGRGLNDVVCVPDCDPLAQDCPSATDACNLMSGQWGCYPRDSTSTGDARWPCSFPNDCAPFFACVREEDFAGCSNSHGACCAPLCDLVAPDADSVCAAAGIGLSCKPWPPEGEPTGYDHVGACVP